MRPKWLKNSSK